MRLPYLQVDGDFLAHKARPVASLLGCSKAAAVGHLTLLWAWAVSQGPEDAAPAGIVTSSRAAVVVAAAAEWEGSPAAFVEALADGSVGLVEVLPVGLRIRGLDRYAAAWDRQRKERARKADYRKKSSSPPAPVPPVSRGTSVGQNADGVGQIKTQTYTQKKEEDPPNPPRGTGARKEPVPPSPTGPPRQPPNAPPEQPALLQVQPAAADTPEALQALWNAEAHSDLPRWREMTESRRKAAAARLRARPLQEWREVIRRVNASPFLIGGGGQGWRATPDWLLQRDSAAKVLEGQYDRSGGTAAGAQVAPVGETCAICSQVGDGANLQHADGPRLWLGYRCGCCNAWTRALEGGRHYSEVYDWARERKSATAA